MAEKLPILVTQITLDASNEYKEYLVSAKQGDKATRFVSVLIVNDGQEYEAPADADLIANFQKPDGTFCYNACTRSGNRILVELTNQVLTAAGTISCEVEVRSSDASQVLTSCGFAIENGKGLRDESAILSSNEMTAFDTKWQQINADMQEWAAVEALRVAAETARADAEEQRVLKETARQAAETARAKTEMARAAAEQASVASEQARAAAEQARVAAEQARLDAETKRQQDTTTAINAAQAATQATEDATARAEAALETQAQLNATMAAAQGYAASAEQSAEQAQQNAQQAAAAATEVINAGVTEKLAQVQAAAQTAVNAKDAAVLNAGQTSADLQATNTAKQDTLAAQAAAEAAALQAQGYAGAATYAFGYDSDGKFTFFFNDGEE